MYYVVRSSALPTGLLHRTLCCESSDLLTDFRPGAIAVSSDLFFGAVLVTIYVLAQFCSQIVPHVRIFCFAPEYEALLLWLPAVLFAKAV